MKHKHHLLLSRLVFPRKTISFVAILFFVPALSFLFVAEAASSTPGGKPPAESVSANEEVENPDRSSRPDVTVIASNGGSQDPGFDDPFSGESTTYTIPDPLQPWNRKVFWFNDRAYIYVLKPAIKGYRAVVGRTIRKGIANVFDNLDEPTNFVNSVLQVRPKDAAKSVSRLVINSTIGIGGIFDPASNWLDESKRTMNQTLGKWGVPPGFYIVWPVYGSSSLRATIGDVADGYAYPPYYLDGEDAIFAQVGLAVLRNGNQVSFKLGQYTDVKEASIDPYSSFKDIYEQGVANDLKR